jgi:biotin transport system substrate-specific component
LGYKMQLCLAPGRDSLSGLNPEKSELLLSSCPLYYNHKPKQNRLKMSFTLPIENINSKQWVMVIFGAIVLALAAQLSIPMEPVPLTFQSTTVILLGFAFGPRLGANMVVAYLLAGMLGLPVFANFQAGIPVLMSPRGGYLVGFLPAVVLAGYLANRGMSSTFLRSLISAIASDAIIFLLGVCWLAGFTGWQMAITVGCVPFIISELVKLTVLAFVAPKLK